MKKRNMFIVMFLVLVLALTGCSNKEKAPEQVGNHETIVLPAFKLNNLNGEEISSDIFENNDINILALWQSTWGPCIKELEALNAIYDEYKDKGVNIIGIALDDVETYGDEGIKGVVDLLELKFENIIADRDYMAELIKFTKATPTAIIVNSKGEFLLPPMPGSGTADRAIKEYKEIIEALQNN